MHFTLFQSEIPPPESSWVSWNWNWIEFPPDGTLAYGPYDHDGFSCIGAQRLDRATMRPVGVRLPVFHAHAVRLNDRFSVWVGRELMVFGLAEHTGNIWMAEWKGGW